MVTAIDLGLIGSGISVLWSLATNYKNTDKLVIIFLLILLAKFVFV